MRLVYHLWHTEPLRARIIIVNADNSELYTGKYLPPVSNYYPVVHVIDRPPLPSHDTPPASGSDVVHREVSITGIKLMSSSPRFVRAALPSHDTPPASGSEKQDRIIIVNADNSELYTGKYLPPVSNYYPVVHVIDRPPLPSHDTPPASGSDVVHREVSITGIKLMSSSPRFVRAALPSHDTPPASGSEKVYREVSSTGIKSLSCSPRLCQAGTTKPRYAACQR
ncbi:hypothetical protein J6590_020325 [Homalodisca vitripennis]|nr:hypothetical protein J6590_020325 [Homalodisca vitripennis]